MSREKVLIGGYVRPKSQTPRMNETIKRATNHPLPIYRAREALQRIITKTQTILRAWLRTISVFFPFTSLILSSLRSGSSRPSPRRARAHRQLPFRPSLTLERHSCARQLAKRGRGGGARRPIGSDYRDKAPGPHVLPYTSTRGDARKIDEDSAKGKHSLTKQTLTCSVRRVVGGRNEK